MYFEAVIGPGAGLCSADKASDTHDPAEAKPVVPSEAFLLVLLIIFNRHPLKEIVR
jgi:hypothetical protein